MATLNLSGLPWRTIGASLQHENFPLPWLAILRAWAWAGLARSDLALRVLGFLVGIAIVLAIWRTARILGVRWPIASLLLLGFSPIVLRVGDSLRAYGFGVLLVLVTLGAVWRFLETPGPSWLLVALGAAVLCVHSVLYAAVIEAALFAGGTAVALRRRRIGSAVALAASAGIALASLSFYAPSLAAAQSWVGLIQIDVHLKLIVRRLIRAWIEGGYAVALLWVLALPWTLARAARSLRSDRGLFTFVALAVALPGYLIFLRILEYAPQPWYYLPLLALLALSIDATIEGAVRDEPAWRRRRIVLLGVLILVASFTSARAALTRQSTVDLVAETLRARAGADDLVVVYPWWLGVSFARYYQGAAPWTTVPEIEDHSLHRYDLVQERLRSPDPFRPLLEKIETTLRAGGRVWLATNIEHGWWEHGNSLEDPSTAKPRDLAEDARATLRFARELGALLDRLSPRVEQPRIERVLPVNRNENLRLFELSIPSARS